MGLSKSRLFTGILLLVSIILLGRHSPVEAQRSLLHWKRDLEQRLKIYDDHQNVIKNIITSSIYPVQNDQLVRAPIRLAPSSIVHFSDLIIPVGSLRLNPVIAQNAVQIMLEKTRSYVASKTNELNHIQHQLATLSRELDNPARQFIFKGQRPGSARFNQTRPRSLITGLRVFRHAQYVSAISSPVMSVGQVNNTNVERVIDDTYLRNTKFAVRDSKGRPYFEGRKTFFNTVFTQDLESGCCGRLKPLDTSRMMLRSVDQAIRAPVLIRSEVQRGPASRAAVISQLSAGRFFNQIVELNPRQPAKNARLMPGDIGLMPVPPPENFIQTTNLIRTHQLDGAEILKTLVFTSPVNIDEALLARSYVDSRLVIGIANMPGFFFDLSHDNYLLRFHQSRPNYTVAMQRVSGAFVIDGTTNFVGGVEAAVVNNIANFPQFIGESVVRIDRPSVIQSPVQFNALPTMLNAPMSFGPSRQPQNVLIVRVRHGLEVGTVNGMRVPQDLVLLSHPSAPADQNARLALKPGELVRVRGPRRFASRAEFNFLDVNGTISGLQMPAGVIPLHLNDFIDSAGYSNLWFMDGISTILLHTQSNQFDTINLREVNGDAQSIVMKSMLQNRPDGSLLIRAPLRVTNLHLIQTGPSTGQLNGFRPQEVLELNPPRPDETIYGQKTFEAPVEATDCVFTSINNVANWTNQLIRIDRPNTSQTVYTKLIFNGRGGPVNYSNSTSQADLNIGRMNVDFLPDDNPTNYQRNWNLSPELYLMQQALLRAVANSTGGRYRVNQVRLMNQNGGFVNGIALNDIVTLDQPFRFDRFTMVGKVEVNADLIANRIRSNYPIDAMDLVQFNKYRIPIVSNTLEPIRLNNLVLGPANQASFVRCQLLNGVSFNEFVASIMSLTRPQEITSKLVFNGPVSFEGLVRTRSSLNGIKDFAQFADRLRSAKYLFERGLQCNSVVVRA